MAGARSYPFNIRSSRLRQRLHSNASFSTDGIVIRDFVRIRSPCILLPQIEAKSSRYEEEEVERFELPYVASASTSK